MYRIKLFADFNNTDGLKHTFEKANRVFDFDEYGNGKKIYFVSEGEDYTHAIILNTVMPRDLNLPPEKVVGFALEPMTFLNITREFIEYAQTHIGIYYVGDHSDLPFPFVEGPTYLDHIPVVKHLLPKTKVMSIMVSKKGFAPGHKYRHKLVEEILKTDLPIDIYGNGCPFHGTDKRLKGGFAHPSVMLHDYKFHVCIENFVSSMYFSEKIIDSICTQTTPIYLGCKNINMFFPNMSIPLTGNVTKDINILTEICQQPDKFKTKIDTSAELVVNLICNILQDAVFP